MNQNRALGNFLLLALGAVLFVYTAFRTYDVLRMSLPSDATEMAVVGIMGIDGAVIAWTLYKLFGARGEWQHAIANVMIIVSLVGVLVSVLGDTLMRQPNVAVPGYIKTAVWWGIPALIWLNVAMAIAAHLTDPRHQIKRAQRDVEDAIEAAVAEKLRENAANIASAVAPDVAAHRAEEVQRRILTTVGLVSPNGRKAKTFASDVEEMKVRGAGKNG